jgi:hypothetical protein
MTNDPIVEEVRAARERIAEKFGYDVGAICRDLRQRIARGEFEVVRLAPKPPRVVPDRAVG